MKRPEQAFQQAVVRFIDAAAPGLLYFHVPNGGARSKVEGAIFKTMGVKAGVADLIFMLPTGKFGAMELKAGRGRLSPAQEDFREKMLKGSRYWAEVRTLEEVEETLHKWLTPLGWKLKARAS